jgi:hypothetical protein
MLGEARDNVFGREKAGKVLSDDFVGLIAEQALRSGVPTEQLPI